MALPRQIVSFASALNQTPAYIGPERYRADGYVHTGTGEELTPAYNIGAIEFSADGTLLFVSDSTNSKIVAYTLSTAWDVSTASIDTGNELSPGFAAGPFAFKTDGTRLFVANNINDYLYEYDLSTAWDLTTASYNGDAQRYYFNAFSNNTFYDMRFSSDGTKFYACDPVDDIIGEFPMSTAWDVSTASYSTANDLTLPTAINGIQGFDFSSDGKKVIVIDSSENVRTIKLTVAWDVSTGILASGTLATTAQVTGNAAALRLSASGYRLFISDTSTDDIVEYEITQEYYYVTGDSSNAIDVYKTSNPDTTAPTAQDGTNAPVETPTDISSCYDGRYIHIVTHHTTDYIILYHRFDTLNDTWDIVDNTVGDVSGMTSPTTGVGQADIVYRDVGGDEIVIVASGLCDTDMGTSYNRVDLWHGAGTGTPSWTGPVSVDAATADQSEIDCRACVGYSYQATHLNWGKHVTGGTYPDGSNRYASRTFTSGNTLNSANYQNVNQPSYSLGSFSGQAALYDGNGYYICLYPNIYDLDRTISGGGVAEFIVRNELSSATDALLSSNEYTFSASPFPLDSNKNGLVALDNGYVVFVGELGNPLEELRTTRAAPNQTLLSAAHWTNYQILSPPLSTTSYSRCQLNKIPDEEWKVGVTYLDNGALYYTEAYVGPLATGTGTLTAGSATMSGSGTLESDYPKIATYTTQSETWGGVAENLVQEIVCTKPPGVQNGDILVIALHGSRNSFSAWASHTGWSFVGVNESTGSGNGAAIYWRTADGTEGSTETMAIPSSAHGVTAYYFRVINGAIDGYGAEGGVMTAGSVCDITYDNGTEDYPDESTTGDALTENANTLLISITGGYGSAFQPWTISDSASKPTPNPWIKYVEIESGTGDNDDSDSVIALQAIPSANSHVGYLTADGSGNKTWSYTSAVLGIYKSVPKTGTGTLTAGSATIVGSGTTAKSHTGTATLTPTAATLAGVGYKTMFASSQNYYAEFSGATNNEITTPDSVGHSITGDIEIIINFALPFWNSGGSSSMAIISKMGGSPNNEWGLRKLSNGVLYFQKSTSGSGYTSRACGTIPATDNWTRKWLRITHVVSTGVTTSYISDTNGNWSQFGQDTGHLTGNFPDTAAPLYIGNEDGGSQELTGHVYDVLVYDGVGGTLAYEFHASENPTNQATHDSSLETWTWSANVNSVGEGLTAGYATIVGTGVFELSGTATLTSQSATIVGTGVETKIGTATLTAQAATVTATGDKIATATGTLSPGAAVISGAGYKTFIVSDALTPTAATVVGSGSVYVEHTGTGTLTADAAVIVGAGYKEQLATGTLTAGSAVVAGNGVFLIDATATLTAGSAIVSSAGYKSLFVSDAMAAGSAVIVGTGDRVVVGTSTLTPTAAVIVGAGYKTLDLSDALTAGSAIIVGAGDVGLTITASGTLTPTAATITATGDKTLFVSDSLISGSAIITATGVYLIDGTATLTPTAATVSGAGYKTFDLSDDLVSGSATIVGAGESTLIGTATLTADAASITGTAIYLIDGSGTLAAGSAVMSSAGVRIMTGTAILSADAASITGAGYKELFISDALIAQSATIVGAGDRIVVGTSNLVTTAATIAGTGVIEHIGTGTLVAGAAIIAGAGQVGLDKTGTGILTGQSAVIAGAGYKETFISDSLVSGSALITGAADRVIPGTATLTAQGSTISGTGIFLIDGTSTLNAGAASITGAGVRTVTGAAALTAQAANVTGAGVRIVPGSATLSGQSASVSSSGYLEHPGTGTLTAGSAVMSSAGVRVMTGTAILTGGSASITGAGYKTQLSSGTLVALAAVVSSSGVIEHPGTGTLTAGSATVTGVVQVGGEKVATGSMQPGAAIITGVGFRTIISTGALQAGAASITATGTTVGNYTGAGTLQPGAANVVGIGRFAYSGTGTLTPAAASMTGAGTVGQQVVPGKASASVTGQNAASSHAGGRARSSYVKG